MVLRIWLLLSSGCGLPYECRGSRLAALEDSPVLFKLFFNRDCIIALIVTSGYPDLRTRCSLDCGL